MSSAIGQQIRSDWKPSAAELSGGVAVKEQKLAGGLVQRDVVTPQKDGKTKHETMVFDSKGEKVFERTSVGDKYRSHVTNTTFSAGKPVASDETRKGDDFGGPLNSLDREIHTEYDASGRKASQHELSTLNGMPFKSTDRSFRSDGSCSEKEVNLQTRATTTRTLDAAGHITSEKVAGGPSASARHSAPRQASPELPPLRRQPRPGELADTIDAALAAQRTPSEARGLAHDSARMAALGRILEPGERAVDPVTMREVLYRKESLQK